MNSKLYTLILYILVAGIVFTSCVSSKKYAASQAKVNKLQKDSANTLEQLNYCYTNIGNISSEKLNLQTKYDSIQNEMIMFIKSSNLTINDQAMRIKGLNSLVFAQKEMLSKLINSLDDALTHYDAADLSVYTKDGQVYVSLEEKLLFKPGSDVVDVKGKEALKILAGVLNTSNDINVMIEGHTDDIAISTYKYKDNWDLSTARATSIVRILTNEFGFDPSRITASGRGKFQPIKINDTLEGRAANRRTEIILTPNLEDLFRVIYQ